MGIAYDRLIVGGGTNFNEMCEAFVEGIVDPLVYFLEDRIEDGGAILGILERHKRRTEWFHQGELYSRYHADTVRGEATLDAHLREYLVDQGIAFQFSQPSSPSGEADVVTLGDDPLALEIKLFSPNAGKDRGYVRQGFAQAYRYAADYGLPAGYLVVFNLTPNSLAFTSDHPGRWPATITVGERTVFCCQGTLVSGHRFCGRNSPRSGMTGRPSANSIERRGPIRGPK